MFLSQASNPRPVSLIWLQFLVVWDSEVLPPSKVLSQALISHLADLDLAEPHLAELHSVVPHLAVLLSKVNSRRVLKLLQRVLKLLQRVLRQLQSSPADSDSVVLPSKANNQDHGVLVLALIPMMMTESHGAVTPERALPSKVNSQDPGVLVLALMLMMTMRLQASLGVERAPETKVANVHVPAPTLMTMMSSVAVLSGSVVKAAAAAAVLKMIAHSPGVAAVVDLEVAATVTTMMSVEDFAFAALGDR